MYNIKDLFLFERLDDEIVTEIIARLPPPKEYKKGDSIFSEAAFENAVGIFLQGKGAAKSGSAFKNTFDEGSVFGVAAVFGAGDVYVSEIIAKTTCLIQFIPETILREIICKNTICAENYICFLSGRIRYLNQKINQYTGSTAASRLYRYFTDNADTNGAVAVPNMSALARLTGLGRTSLYRAMEELENAGSIVREKEKITVK